MRWRRRLLHLALLASLAVASVPATPARVEIQAGRSYMDRYAASTVFVEALFAEHALGDTRFSWVPDVSAGWIDGRNVAQFRYNRYTTHDAVWLVAAGARLHYGDAADWYRPLFFSFQPAWQSGRTQALSSGYEFVSTLGWQGRRFSVQLRHVSNGDLHDPNRGETMALVGAAFDP
jgi:hypothetical protein